MKNMAERYTVILVNQLGQILNRDGTLYRTDSDLPHFEQTFIDLDAAHEFCKDIVRELPHVECDIFWDKQIISQHFDAEWRRQEANRIRKQLLARRLSDILSLSIIIGIGTFGVVLVMVIMFAFLNFLYFS
ncbi:MAG TPA: hypothetical protein VEF04_16430 [Blastocatellia bacterium]|nr:hypothetical protein [Blastocatellia bacterium]